MMRRHPVRFCLLAVAVGVAPPSVIRSPHLSRPVVAQIPATNFVNVADLTPNADSKPALSPSLRGRAPFVLPDLKKAEGLPSQSLESTLRLGAAIPDAQFDHQQDSESAHAPMVSTILFASSLGALIFVAAAFASSLGALIFVAAAGVRWWRQRAQLVQKTESVTEMTAASSMHWSEVERSKFVMAAFASEQRFDPIGLTKDVGEPKGLDCEIKHGLHQLWAALAIEQAPPGDISEARCFGDPIRREGELRPRLVEPSLRASCGAVWGSARCMRAVLAAPADGRWSAMSPSLRCREGALGVPSLRGGMVCRGRISCRLFGEQRGDMSNDDRRVMEDIIYPPDQMWQVSEDGTSLREYYPGARDNQSVFWAIIQPGAALGFLILGVSSWLLDNGYPAIVDVSVWTRETFPWLRPGPDIQFNPQGAFLTFYGFFGFFIFGPLQWYLVFGDKGSGVVEFNQKTQRISIIRDDELLKDIPFDDIDQVVLVFSELTLGERTIYLKDKEGDRIDFLDDLDAPTKAVLERKASILAEFINKELLVAD